MLSGLLSVEGKKVLHMVGPLGIFTDYETDGSRIGMTTTERANFLGDRTNEAILTSQVKAPVST